MFCTAFLLLSDRAGIPPPEDVSKGSDEGVEDEGKMEGLILSCLEF